MIRTPSTTGVIELGGTLNLNGQTLDNSTGSWTLIGGTVKGGTVTNDLLTAPNATSTLQDVTLAGTLTFSSNAGLNLAGAGLTLLGTALTLNAGNSIVCSGTQTLGGSGTVNLNNGSNVTDNGSGDMLTIGTGVSINLAGGTLANVATQAGAPCRPLARPRARCKT